MGRSGIFSYFDRSIDFKGDWCYREYAHVMRARRGAGRAGRVRTVYRMPGRGRGRKRMRTRRAAPARTIVSLNNIQQEPSKEDIDPRVLWSDKKCHKYAMFKVGRYLTTVAWNPAEKHWSGVPARLHPLPAAGRVQGRPGAGGRGRGQGQRVRPGRPTPLPPPRWTPPQTGRGSRSWPSTPSPILFLLQNLQKIS